MSCIIEINGYKQDNLANGVIKINQILKTNLVKKIKFGDVAVYTKRIVNSSLLEDNDFISACYNLSLHETEKKEYEIFNNTVDINNTQAQGILNNINLKKDISDMILFLESKELFKILEIKQIKNSLLFEEIQYWVSTKTLIMHFRGTPFQTSENGNIKLIFR